MEIRFEGLICHARLTDDAGTTRDLAVLMREPRHVPLLTVRHRQGSTNPADTDIVQQGAPNVGSNPEVRCFRLVGPITTSLGSGLSSGTPSSVLAQVPSLNDNRVATGDRTPHTDARNRRPNAARYNAVLDLPPGGSYAVIAHFPDRGRFGTNDLGCIPRTIRYTATTGSNVRFNLQGGQFLVIKPTSIVYVTNVCTINCKGGPPHFQAYHHMFNGPTTIVAPTNGAACNGLPEIPHDTCGGAADLDVDCANTRFP